MGIPWGISYASVLRWRFKDSGTVAVLVHIALPPLFVDGGLGFSSLVMLHHGNGGYVIGDGEWTGGELIVS